MSDQDFLQGQLLIAMPNLNEGCFKESVVLICSHDETHAMGVIINKKIADLDFSEVLEQLDLTPGPTADDRPVHFGGPVDTKRGVVLHSSDYVSDETVNVLDGVGLTATRGVLAALNRDDSSDEEHGPKKAMLFMGHAGWAAGQLEDELSQNAWLNIKATPDLIFKTRTEDIWQTALARLGINTAMFSAEWSTVRDPDTPLN
jgi:putative transcriptional regulator